MLPDDNPRQTGEAGAGSAQRNIARRSDHASELSVRLGKIGETCGNVLRCLDQSHRLPRPLVAKCPDSEIRIISMSCSQRISESQGHLQLIESSVVLVSKFASAPNINAVANFRNDDTGRPLLKQGCRLIKLEPPILVQPVFRFAPSPNGWLHLGHAYAALVDYELCRKADGRFLLRIEDIDRTRCKPEFETAIYEDLAWLGLTWEEPVRRQSEHMEAYGEALARLIEMELVYPSFMSRSEIRTAASSPNWPRDPDGAPLYPGTDRDLDPALAKRRIAAGELFALRLRMDAAVARAGALSWTESGSGPGKETGVLRCEPTRWGDVILARKETPTSYHLSVVVDDARQGITHIVRGQDLFLATSVHRLLQKLLGLPEPAYHHHRLILDEDGRKLSKSDQDTALRSLRAAGATPSDIRRMVGL